MRKAVPTSFRSAAALAFVIAQIACGGDSAGPTAPPSPPSPPSPSPASVAIVAGESQVVLVGTGVWTAPAVIVKGANGTPLANVNVAFAVTAGGGSLSGTDVKTDAAGIATVGGWIVGSAPGTNKLTAQVSGLSAVEFTAIATASAEGSTDLLASAAGYAGQWPAPGRIGFLSAGQTIRINAYPAQVQLVFRPGTPESSAHTLIRQHGGTILSQLPVAGYYLVGVRAGTEADFIGAVVGNTNVSMAHPHPVTMYGTESAAIADPPRSSFEPRRSIAAGAVPPIVLIDDCREGRHGSRVVRAGVAGGGVMGECLDDGSGNASRAAADQTIRHLIAIGAKDGGKNRLVNISSYGGVQYENGGDADYFALDEAEKAVARNSWLTSAKTYVEAVANLPPDKRTNLVVGLCAGNNNTPIGPLIAALRQDARYATVLRENLLFVGATNAAFEDANDAPGDADFAAMTNAATDVPSQRGCSYATPRALAIIQQIMAAYDLSARDALAEAKRAVAANREGALSESEALAQAAPIPVTIAVSGSGTGTVSPYGTGTRSFRRGEVVSLTAQPASGSAFAGWISINTGGNAPCDYSNDVCTFTVSSAVGGAIQVTAVFVTRRTVNQIAFTSSRDSLGIPQIYVMNANGGGQTRLTHIEWYDRLGWRGGSINPAWSPDGRKIAFSSVRPDHCSAVRCDREIYVMNADGSAQTRLTNSPDGDTDPTWSPDGSKIAFVSARDGRIEIWVMNADGSGQTKVSDTNAGLTGFLARPAWSPDGSKIAFVMVPAGSSAQIWVMNADGSGKTRLCSECGSPAWSPDGSKLAFTKQLPGEDGNIFVMNADGSAHTRITNYNRETAPHAAGGPTWSSDGSRIAFAGGDGDIYVMSANGGNPTRLTHNPNQNSEPAW